MAKTKTQIRAHYRPYSGSCPRCQRLLDLAAVSERGVWYCSPACAEGRPAAARSAAVEPSWLTNRPRRFHGQRQPKELRSVPVSGSGESS